MPTEIDAIRGLAHGALRNLEAQRQRIDDLNVYPVPDGDTGTNLVLTLRRIVETIDASDATSLPDLCHEIFDVALKAGKGNSGVIFSQILRGFTKTLEQSGEITSPVISRGVRAGSDAAYAAVSRVGAVEGTIITVVREMAEQAEHDVEGGEPSPIELLRRILERGEDALARTPQMLEILERAGVVDAGGTGLVEITRGIYLTATGKDAPDTPVDAGDLRPEAIHQKLSLYQYCTGFVLEGEGLDADKLEGLLASLGDSLLIVGDESTLKVHVHTDDPGAALSVATALGAIDEVEIANMHAQTEAREQRLQRGSALLVLPDLETGLVAVAHGSGNRDVFEAENATVVDGGQTKNPSVGDLVEAIEATPAPSIIVLPNNSNVILAAQEAAGLVSTKDVRIVPSRSVQAGLAALVGYISTNSVEENERQMLDALGSVSTGEITMASRDVELDGIVVREGAYLGLVDGSAVVCNESFDRVALETIEKVLDGGRDHLSIVRGIDAPPLSALIAAIERGHPGLGIEIHEGGQPHYPLLVVAE